MRVRICVFLLLVLSCASAFSETRSVKKQLDLKERQLEQLWAEYWRTQYAIDSGEDKDASVQPIRAKINAVLLDDGFLSSLRAAQLADPALQRRRELFLSDAADARINGNAELVKLVESVTKAEADAR